MRLIFSPRALRRLQDIQSYIAQDNPQAAIRVISRIRQACEMLCEHPKLGRGWDGETRALVVSGLPYRIHYFVVGEEVQVITIAHTSQLPPITDQQF